MLKLGIFGGKYMTDCAAEFPDTWFEKARLCSDYHDPDYISDLNFIED